MSRPLLLVVFGTRPEAIKLAPVILELQRAGSPFQPIVCNTGQHLELLTPVLEWFGIQPDVTLDSMQAGQDLATLAGRLLLQLAPVLSRSPKPAAMIVQGDTTTAMAASLGAFFHGLPVAHVEAGLRTGNLQQPFPEELNRRIVTLASSLHFAPTEAAADALRDEGISGDRVFVVGNTVIDALRLTRTRLAVPSAANGRPRRILVTAHRRESFGAPFEEICLAIRQLVERHPAIHVTFPVHLNPNVQHPVAQLLSNHERIELLEPVEYQRFVGLMLACDLILTDSGGIQEEAAAMGKPTLVLRETTERPEVLSEGTAKLVGASRSPIVSAVEELLADPAAYAAMSQPSAVFGDGYSAGRIVSVLSEKYT